VASVRDIGGVYDMLREELAKYAHEAWSGWMRYVFSESGLHSDGTMIIPKRAVERWTRQIITPYDELPEVEKDSDRDEADRILDICGLK